MLQSLGAKILLLLPLCMFFCWMLISRSFALVPSRYRSNYCSRKKFWTFVTKPDLQDTRNFKYPSGKFFFGIDSLPEETMYVLDGTAALYYAYYSNAAKEFHGAELTKELSDTLIGEMKGEQLIDFALHVWDNEVRGGNVDEQGGEVVEYWYGEGEEKKQKAPPISKRAPDCLDRESIQHMGEEELLAFIKENLGAVRCQALVALLMNFSRFVETLRPRYVAVAFDTAGRSTFRKALYPGYKSKRGKTPADLVPLFPLAVHVLRSAGCCCLLRPGHEADDLMASVGRWARDRGLNVVHCSQDKDMLQLVGTGVHVLIPANYALTGSAYEVVGAEGIELKYGVRPQGMPDLQAIMGDAADSIPGVVGVGKEGAKFLVQRFGSVSRMIRELRLDTLPPPEHFLSSSQYLSTSSLLQKQSKKKLRNESNSEASSSGSVSQGTYDGDGTAAALLDELAKVKPTDKSLHSYLKEQLTAEGLEEVLAKLENRRDGDQQTGEGVSSKPGRSFKPITMLSRLYLCGVDKLQLYLDLVTLRDSIELSDMLEPHITMKNNNDDNDNNNNNNNNNEELKMNDNDDQDDPSDKVLVDASSEGSGSASDSIVVSELSSLIRSEVRLLWNKQHAPFGIDSTTTEDDGNAQTQKQQQQQQLDNQDNAVGDALISTRQFRYLGEAKNFVISAAPVAGSGTGSGSESSEDLTTASTSASTSTASGGGGASGSASASGSGYAAEVVLGGISPALLPALQRLREQYRKLDFE